VNSSLKMTIAAAIAVVAGAACTPAAVAPSTVVSRPPVTPSAAAASAAPSAVPPPSPSGSAALGPLDTSTWKTYTSTRYGFTIGHPADWVERPSQHDYVFPADAAVCCPPPATENIHSPVDDVGMSIWSVTLPAGTTADAWIQAYCQVMEADSPCTALQDSTVPASMDGHAGRLVLFKSDTQAFIPVGDRMYVVACWRSENQPSVVPFGGGQTARRSLSLDYAPSAWRTGALGGQPATVLTRNRSRTSRMTSGPEFPGLDWGGGPSHPPVRRARPRSHHPRRDPRDAPGTDQERR